MKYLTFKDKTFEEISSIVKKSDFVEIRLDLNNITENELKDILKVNKRVLVTTGPASEKYEEFIKIALDMNVAFIDLPYDSKLFENFDKRLSKLIVSYHNYQRTPYEQGLIEIINKMKTHNPDYLKIVTKANKKTDTMRILQLHSFNKNLIAYTFGRNTDFSRFSSYYLGASIIYASLDENSKTAPGQPTMDEVEQVLRIMG
jgi:3-dehydroquinate dehydratase-1